MSVPHNLVADALRVPIFSGLSTLPHPIDPALAHAMSVEANSWVASTLVPHSHPELQAILYLLGLIDIPSYNACLVASIHDSDPHYPVVDAFIRSWVSDP